MFKKLARFALALATCATVSAVTAEAQSITPTGSRFGSLPQATFGGMGIPNDAVMVQESVTGVTMGLTATQRCGTVVCNPALTNDGFGRFFAGAGADLNPPSPTNPYAIWNWNFFLDGAARSSYNYRLYYDFNASAGNAQTTHGSIDLISSLLPAGPFQNSWNLGMDFLATSAPGIVAPAGSFDPNVEGEYTFALVAYEKDGTFGFGSEVGRVAMAVSVVPEPSTYGLMAAGLGMLAVVARRRARTMV